MGEDIYNKAADPRINLSIERTELALERTHLAWIWTVSFDEDAEEEIFTQWNNTIRDYILYWTLIYILPAFFKIILKHQLL